MRNLPILLLAFTLTGCANLNTIGRTTNLNTSEAKAIHLDVKQRLAFGNAEKFCAEASPDALSAFSTGAGFAQGIPSAGNSTSANLAGQESSSSIGLRTQSIALQREIFYRICEAGYNNKISNAQIGVLMARSQDLTSVVLAVEQLTGAVVANQSSLTNGAKTTSASAVSSNAEVIKLLKEDEAEAKANFDTQSNILKGLEETNLPAAKTAESNANSSLIAAQNLDPQPENIQDFQLAYESRKAERENIEASIISQRQNVENAEARYVETRSLVEEYEKLNDAGTSFTRVDAFGDSEFSDNQSKNNISDQTAEHISDAVTTMVTTALNKKYNEELCMGILSAPLTTDVEAYSKTQSTAYKNLYKLCIINVFGASSDFVFEGSLAEGSLAEGSSEATEEAELDSPTVERVVPSATIERVVPAVTRSITRRVVTQPGTETVVPTDETRTVVFPYEPFEAEK